ncbi:MAG: hypothetical protein MJA83_03855 [Gammaproteobacteria bacterium]|nr:hypothetical protein [Gammaproteobacteria bacterium]
MSEPNIPGLPQAANPLAGVITAGQPTPEQLEAAKNEGVKTIVNLCMPGECGWDEEEVVEDLEMHYVSIPMGGAGDITKENAESLHKILEDENAYPMIIHCGSSNRVGALFACKAFHLENCNIDEAVEKGKLAGLTKLEPAVRECLTKCL